MIIKGTSVAGARRLFIHLTRVDSNERVEVRELRGVAAEDLSEALLEMEAVASGSRATKPFYHASINSRAIERMTDEQRAHAIDMLEARLGLTGQPRVVVVHEKSDHREHCHIVWSRIDLETMRTISDSHNFRKHEEVARALEKEFGHERVQGAHIEREGKERPKRTPSHAEMLQAERTGLTPQQVKARVTELWRSTEGGQDFATALWEAGYVLARGDRRDYVVIDPSGGTHSLARRVEGAKAKDIRARMADLESRWVPSVAEAKEAQIKRQARDREVGERSAGGQEGVEPPTATEGRSKAPQEPGREGPALGGALNVAGSLADGIAKIFENLLAGEPEQKPRSPHEIAADAERARKAEQKAQEDARLRQSDGDLERRRQELLREFGKQIQDDREADFERGRERERRGSKPPGAGAAPERQETQPRARSRRGRSESGNAAFFIISSRILFSRNHISTLRRVKPHHVPTANFVRIAFKAQAGATGARITISFAPAADDLGGAAAEAGDDELAKLLAAIDDEVRAWAAGARATAAAEFSGGVFYAQKHLPKHQVAGAVRALKEAYQAALAAIAQRAQVELLARRAAVIHTRLRPRRAARPSSRPKPLDRPRRT